MEGDQTRLGLDPLGRPALHAGAGVWQGVTTGNSSFIGIEAENTGLPNDPWPAVQVEAYQRGVAAILKHIGKGAEFVMPTAN